MELTTTYTPDSLNSAVVYDYKDTKIEWNSQLTEHEKEQARVVYDVKDTKFEWN